MNAPDNALIQQHLIDPEICIRCNTCEASCPIGAITHDSRNYVVKADICNNCNACIPPCPTGAIENYRAMPSSTPYTIEEQLLWDELPVALSDAELQARNHGDVISAGTPINATSANAANVPLDFVNSSPQAVVNAQAGSTLPPWSAAHAYTNLYGPKSPEKSLTATITGNVRVTQVGKDYDTHHIVLDFGQTPFPVLEGQSIGILPPGIDTQGRSHHARQYSIASPRNGERPGYNNLSLTVKRVLEDHQGNPVRGVASNYLCDLEVGSKVEVIGPFGSSFLMPNHPRSNIIMICTGTGSAPMRAMTEWRRRLHQSGKFEGGKLVLFFGARTKEELPYFGPLQNLPKDFIDIHFAFSRSAEQPKQYVQDCIRKQSSDLAPLLNDPNTFIYVCGLKAMEEGVLSALQDVAQQSGITWDVLSSALKREGRLHLETY